MRTCPRCHRPHADEAPCLVTEALRPQATKVLTHPSRAGMTPLAGSDRASGQGAAGATAVTQETSLGKVNAQRSGVRPGADRAEDLIGQNFGAYRLLQVIGRGGMGRVYRAEHVKLGRMVALKLLRPEYAMKKDAVARFFQEAKAVNRTRHRNIVDVTDFIELDDGTTFIIMELLEGTSLGRALRTSRHIFTTPRLLSILVQVCDALEAAHGVDIVHRDLKPDNIYLCPDGRGGEVVKLLDFGVAKLLSHGEESGDMAWRTAAGSVVGTPAYMSPEQACGIPVDGRSDIYALGAILYEMLCNQSVFTGENFGELIQKHVHEPPVPPRETPGGHDVSPALEAVVLRCLQKRPMDRYATVGGLRDDLMGLLALMDPAVAAGQWAESGAHRVAQGSGDHGPSGVYRSLAGAHPLARGTYLTDGPPESEPGWGRMFLIAAVVAVLGGLGLGAYRWAAGGGPRFDEPSAPGAPVATPALTPRVATEPSATPGLPPAPEVESMAAAGPTPARPQASPVTVALRSEPAGAAVYSYGSDALLCRTPCDLTVDPTDGGSPHRRVYVLKREGYEDVEVPVALDAKTPVAPKVVLRRSPEQVRPQEERAVTRPTSPAPAHPARPAPNERPAPQSDRIDPTDTLNPFRDR